MNHFSHERIREICNYLDVDCYGKNCNFLQEDDDNGLLFYSRDLCHNITFRELLEWYIPRLGNFDLDIHEDIASAKENQLETFMELIEIYSYYKMIYMLQQIMK